MDRRLLFWLLPLASLGINATSNTHSAYVLSSNHQVTIHGTSNLHDWQEKVTVVTGSGLANENKNGSIDLLKMTIRMNVLSIKSDKGATMNNNTYKALNAENHPEIIFELISPILGISTSNNKSKTVVGNLTIAGTTKPVYLNILAIETNAGALTVEGVHSIKMTDYNIKPPTALLGTLKTGNEITIRFKTSFTKSKIN